MVHRLGINVYRDSDVLPIFDFTDLGAISHSYDMKAVTKNKA